MRPNASRAFGRFPESPGWRGFWFSHAYTNGSATGGMPMYKFIGNKILTWIENKFLGIRLERVPFRVQALRGPGT